MQTSTTTDLARTLMLQFAEATGLTDGEQPRRYLWTDAFAVGNFLGLYCETGEEEFLDLARRLVDQVHHVLGRHREDDPREGWISGLPHEAAEQHPTRGGLRIGKPLNERGPDDPPDARLEWDRDGQYFHYLTKWMHALARMAQETGQPHYLRWAAELADAAQRAFTCDPPGGGPLRMVWKMSIDLSRPLVSSMGHHDPLDGLVSCLELQSADGFESCGAPGLTSAIDVFSEMCEDAGWATEDPLGVGGLLEDAARLTRIVFARGQQRHELLKHLLDEADLSLRMFSRVSPLGQPVEHRLAFRELGLSIGLQGIEQVHEELQLSHEVDAVFDRLLRQRLLAEDIRDFWSDSHHRHSRSWIAHDDINTVMLATALHPRGYFEGGSAAA